MKQPSILCVGFEPHLLETRSMILRQAGYIVCECAVLADALSALESKPIDLVLICNSIPRAQQEWLTTEIMNRSCMMPILCIQNHPYERGVNGCVSVDNGPETLLAAIECTVIGRRDTATA
jgi:DNA-binding NtrC family response regulator